MKPNLDWIEYIPLAAACITRKGELVLANSAYHTLAGDSTSGKMLSALPSDGAPRQVKLPSGTTVFTVTGSLEEYLLVLLCPLEHFPREISLAGLLFSHARDGILVIDENHRIVAANPQFCSMLGYDQEEITELHTWDYAVDFDEEHIREIFKDPQEIQRSFENIHRRKDGSTYPVEVSITGIPSGLFLCICKDMSEKRALEQEKLEAYRVMKQTLERIQDAFISLDASLHFTYINRQGSLFLGAKEEELLGTSILDTPPFSDVREFREMLYPKDKVGVTGHREIYVPDKDLWIEIRFYPSEEGHSIFFHDITQRKRSQESIYYQFSFQKLLTDCSSVLLQATEENFDEGVYDVLKRFGSFLSVDRSRVGLFHEQDDSLDITYEWCAPDIPSIRDQHQHIHILQCSRWMDLFTRGEPVIIEHTADLEDTYGREELQFLKRNRILSMLCYPILEGNILKGLLWFDTQTRVISWKRDGKALFPLAANILAETLRKHRVQVELSRERRRLQDIITGTNAGTWEWNIQTDIMHVNDRWHAISGYPEAPACCFSCDQWKRHYHPDDVKVAEYLMRLHLEGSRPLYQWEGRIRHHRGHWIWVVDRGSVVSRDAQGRPVMVSGTRQDITERKQMEELLRYIVEHTRSAIAVHDRNLNYIYVSQRYLEEYGITSEQVIGRHHYEVFPDLPEKWREVHQRCLAGEVISKEDDPYPREDGTVEWTNWECRPWYESDGSVGGIIVYTEVVTPRKEAEEQRLKLQEQLAQASKMESIGRLAGGIAHDFNNMLQAIIGHGELALEQIEQTHPVREDVSVILEAARKSADLTRQLLAYARKQTIQPRMLDLNHAVTSILPMIKRVIGSDNTITWNPGKHVPPVSIDPAQMDQVLLNLCVNADDAVESNGSIVISTSEYTDETGSFAQLSVKDNGCGIDQDLLPYIFEPFFTTKEVGSGTGLGLPMVHGMVTQNRGTITLNDLDGKGTEAVIRLPSCLETQEQKPSRKHPEHHPPDKPLRVLLVDDEQEILSLIYSQLDSLGYYVEAAPSANQLLGTFNPDLAYDLLITDVMMPEKNGVELAAELREYFPLMKVLFISGYSAEVLSNRGLKDTGSYFIQKPFTRKDLMDKLLELFTDNQ